ncbi:Multiple myeloma tumor-associated protein, putative [Perkinsus marinus ATCC 50983]|uniref:Multiple myeloma tumor-associated protein, putative n=1 Tax=Perkinsus marinus (strain ATCC 50983 / TXsc) TaxID=423536 RepID=C5LSI3_PERM5|nr:Multiple myeloma tumor-associated protein, putative [Perkinsus marinus ATCC 50983]EER00224.1 Multiple myeloma tumor-associated protein, putative [Perkinsus marinus ATCC 50983]|eukprot:XP_002767506.1 Multiple myeloma tumor-associated protein, putative [Perkinsus marinus ATCC 50983]
MADIRPDGPPREGVRGGLEQFKWDDIKNISYKDREQYLGYSTRLGQLGKFGRWNRNDWWRTERRGAKQIEDERSSIQQYENEIMLEALGQKPKRLLLMRSDNMTPEQLAAIARGDDPDKPKDADGNVKDENAAGPGDDDYETQKLIEESNSKKGMGFNPYAKQADRLYGKSNTTVLGEDGVTREVVKLDEDDNVKKELDEEADDNREEWEYRPPPRKVLGPVMPGRERVKEELEEGEEEEDPRDAKARRKAEKKLAKKIKKDERRAEKKRRKEHRER